MQPSLQHSSSIYSRHWHPWRGAIRNLDSYDTSRTRGVLLDSNPDTAGFVEWDADFACGASRRTFFAALTSGGLDLGFVPVDRAVFQADVHFAIDPSLEHVTLSCGPLASVVAEFDHPASVLRFRLFTANESFELLPRSVSPWIPFPFNPRTSGSSATWKINTFIRLTVEATDIPHPPLAYYYYRVGPGGQADPNWPIAAPPPASSATASRIPVPTSPIRRYLASSQTVLCSLAPQTGYAIQRPIMDGAEPWPLRLSWSGRFLSHGFRFWNGIGRFRHNPEGGTPYDPTIPSVSGHRRVVSPSNYLSTSAFNDAVTTNHPTFGIHAMPVIENRPTTRPHTPGSVPDPDDDVTIDPARYCWTSPCSPSDEVTVYGLIDPSLTDEVSTAVPIPETPMEFDAVSRMWLKKIRIPGRYGGSISVAFDGVDKVIVAPDEWIGTPSGNIGQVGASLLQTYDTWFGLARIEIGFTRFTDVISPGGLIPSPLHPIHNLANVDRAEIVQSLSPQIHDWFMEVWGRSNHPGWPPTFDPAPDGSGDWPIEYEGTFFQTLPPNSLNGSRSFSYGIIQRRLHEKTSGPLANPPTASVFEIPVGEGESVASRQMTFLGLNGLVSVADANWVSEDRKIAVFGNPEIPTAESLDAPGGLRLNTLGAGPRWLINLLTPITTYHICVRRPLKPCTAFVRSRDVFTVDSSLLPDAESRVRLPVEHGTVGKPLKYSGFSLPGSGSGVIVGPVFPADHAAAESPPQVPAKTAKQTTGFRSRDGFAIHEAVGCQDEADRQAIIFVGEFPAGKHIRYAGLRLNLGDQSTSLFGSVGDNLITDETVYYPNGFSTNAAFPQTTFPGRYHNGTVGRRNLTFSLSALLTAMTISIVEPGESAGDGVWSCVPLWSIRGGNYNGPANAAQTVTGLPGQTIATGFTGRVIGQSVAFLRWGARNDPFGLDAIPAGHPFIDNPGMNIGPGYARRLDDTPSGAMSVLLNLTNAFQAAVNHPRYTGGELAVVFSRHARCQFNFAVSEAADHAAINKIFTPRISEARLIMWAVDGFTGY